MNERTFGSLVTGGIIALVLIVAAFAILRTVDQGEICVVTAFGKVTRIASPGLNGRWPLVERFNCFSSRAAVYETSDAPGESQADYTDVTVNANTSDGQVIDVRYSVSFHIEPEQAMTVYTQVAKNNKEVVERVVKFYSRSHVRLILQENQADYLYSGSIIEVQSEVEAKLKDLFAENYVTLDSFVIRKISFDPDYVAAIEQQQIAKENIETAQYNSQAAVYSAQQTAELAKGQAQANIEIAKGDAESIRIKAIAEAEALATKGQALRSLPEMLK